uniref:TP53-binding protein 1 n=1 Tax=Salmo trutta TaxID=8032 RepID=A0A673Z876_SALTR
MDPSGSDLDSSLPHAENPCLIVEDSQPDSAALEDDPDSSYRALLARRLSSLQPATSHSPVLVSSTFNKVSGSCPRSEVSSSSSSEPLGCAGQELSVQALLHSQGLQASEDQDPKGDDSELLSSQEDLFDTDKTGTGVDSTMSEPENQGVPTLTPAHTLHLLHLSGQGTLVQESLSQNSVDFVAPSQENLSQTPFIVPNSPTGQENELGADEPMDTSMPPEDQSDGKEEPMDMDPAPKSHPSASTPVSQNSPGFVLERTLSLPTQPEFSHDVFVPTQSQEAGSSSIAPQETHSRKVTSSSQPTALDSSSPKMAAAPAQSKAPTTTDREHSVTDSFQLELSVNTQSCSLAQQASMQAGGKDVEEDSQATQIEGLDGPLRIDTSDSVISRNSQKRDSNGVPSDPKTPAILPKVPQVPDLLKTSGESTRREECNTLQKSDTHKQTTLNVRNVNIGYDGINVIKTDSSQKQDAKASTPSLSSQQKLETIDLFTPSSCVQETPSSSNSTPCSLASLSQSQSVFSQIPTSSQKNRDPSKSIQSLSQERGGTATNSPKEKNKADEEEEEEGMEEGGEKQQDSTLGPEGSGLYLSLSQSQVLSPEPMEEEEEEKRGKFPVSHSRREGGEEESSSIIVLEESERSSQLLEKEVKSPSKMGTSQPVASRRGSVSSNGTGSQLKDTQLLPIGLAQAEKEGSTEAEGLRDKSLSDSSGEIPFHFTLPKEGELIGPPVSATPPLISQLKQTPRHSTPIDMTSFSEKSAAVGDVSTETAMATSEITAGESGDDTAEEADGKLSLRMKLVTPVEEGSSERFSLQSKSCYSVPVPLPSPLPSPSVFSRVREAHRKVMEDQAKAHPSDPGTPGEPETPPSRAAAGPAHRRHVRTIQEVRTTVTRIITDVYYEDGREVDRKVTEESEEPVVDSRVLDSDISPCRTGSSMTSGDLGDVSSLSSKASSQQHSSGGTSIVTGPAQRGPDFIMPPSRGAKGAGVPRANARGQPLSSSEDESYTRLCPTPRIPESPAVPSHSSTSLLTTTSQDEVSPAGSSFVGLRVVAKWSSNGYFYSGRITKDLGEGRYRLLFDDSYECEVTGKDILLCDPIPLNTEVTALLEDEYFSTGRVKDYKKEGEDLFYSVEKQGQTTWYSRSSVILTMEQGNRLREQYGLGPYEPVTPLAKASDISLDNLVEGKRRRRGITGGASPLTPGPSGKRKLISSEDRDRTPAKRGRRGGGGARAGQRVGVCNTSGSGTDLPWDHSDLAETHGPLPQSASLFLGFAFMLTASSESDRQTNQPISDGEEEYVQTAPYHKRYTETQLEAGAGFILHDFNEEQCKAAYQSLLITDQHSRTRKYLLCVASGVPCVSHIWVRDCCKEGKLLNYRNYLLPAGVGPDERIVEWHPRCSPFKALRVLLVFEEPAELWSELLMMSGASSVRQHQAEKDSSDIPVGKFDVVVTDRTCPPLVLKSVTSQEVPMVSPEWLIHSLICGERLGYHSNPQYHHDYTSSS